MVALDEAIYDKLIEYREDPVGFYLTVLGIPEERVWSKMREIAESVRDHQFTAVKAGHSVSKTYGAGRLVVWYKSCWFPSTVVTTAPTEALVKGQLWREIHAAIAGATTDLGPAPTTLEWDLKPNKEVLASLPPEARELWEKNFAIGFSTSPDSATGTATKMHGWHNEHMLIVMDEACGIHPQIWRTAIEGLVTNPRVKVLAIGNPTDPNSEFARCFDPDTEWNCITIKVQDTPNYVEGREVIHGLAGRSYEQRLRKHYGPTGNEYLMRVLGEFPTFKEGTYYGFEVNRARDKGQFGEYSYDPTQRVYGFWDLGDVYSVGLFCQFWHGRIKLIDMYYDNRGRGLPEFAKVCDTKDFLWGGHWAGPDLVTSNKKSVQTGLATRDIAASLGMDIAPVMKHAFNDGVEAVRSIWKILDINATLCKEAIEAFGQYGKKKNEALSDEDKPVYYNEPLKNYACHFADALRHLAIYYRYMTDEGYMGYAHEEKTLEPVGVGDTYGMDYDPLNRNNERRNGRY